MPVGAQLSERRPSRGAAGRRCAAARDYTTAAENGQLPWRCAEYRTPPSNAGVGCVLRALCSVMARSPEALGLWRDTPLQLLGGIGSELTFATTQAALERLVKTDAPAGALVMRRLRGVVLAWDVLCYEFGVYLFGCMLRRANGTHVPHAVGYNAEAKLLFLGMATLALTEDDLADISGFLEDLELEYGLYVNGKGDVRRLYVVPSHQGARLLPIFPPGCLNERPADQKKRRRKR